MKSPIIIIGMHRSGTSMITRYLEESGIYMGSKKSMGPNEETVLFQRLNEFIFAQKNITWDNSYNNVFSNEFLRDNLSRVIKNLLSNPIRTGRYFGSRYNIFGKNLLNFDVDWGWKDPKSTLNLDVWSKVFPDARIIHIYRNPLDVASSLRSREFRLVENMQFNFKTFRKELFLSKKPFFVQSARVCNIDEGINLWKEYINHSMEADKFFKNVIHVCYENFLDDPSSVLKSLFRFLNRDLSSDLLLSIANNIQPSRKFAFLEDEELLNIYHKRKNEFNMGLINYDKII